jgi:hypothetical protein
MKISCENVRWNHGWTRRNFHEFICSFIIFACNVVELEAVAFVLDAPYLLAVGFHLGIAGA